MLTGQGYGTAIDMWAVGVILYILLCGFPPFGDEDETALLESIKRGAFDYPADSW